MICKCLKEIWEVWQQRICTFTYWTHFEYNGFVSLSFLGDNLVLLNCNIRSDSSISSWLVWELICCFVDTFSKWQWISIVEEVNLFDSCFTLIDCTNTWVLLIKPRSLNISLLLWIVVLWVYFTNKIWNSLNSHLLKWTDLSTCLSWSSCSQLSSSLVGIHNYLLSKIVSVLSSKVSSILLWTMTWDNSPKTSMSSLHWSVH